MGGPEVERLIGLLSRLPGLGPRSARRAALKLLQQPEQRMVPLAQALVEAAKAVRICHICGNLDAQDPCSICADPGRDHALICVVEGVGDLWAIERSAAHRGLYHVLGGVLSPLGGVGPEDLNVASLLKRLTDGSVQEVILALGATVDGAATAHWLADRLAESRVIVSRVAQGVPIGGALEVLDDGTLSTALRARRPA
jgi:recombination protein RecR